MTTVWMNNALPFLLGLNNHQGNPHEMPDCLPFSLVWDDCLGLLRQVENDNVARLLDVAYAKGSLLGTAMDDSPMGRRYAEDMLGFIRSVAEPAGRKLLEVGAGRGYLLRLLHNAGAEVLGIEPGAANQSHWVRHGVPIIEGLFPYDLPPNIESFDVVIAYAVLEHVADPVSMLCQIWQRLSEGGVVCLAVPDCTSFIAAGDPAMLLHEHYSYFTSQAMTRLLASAGFSEVTTRTADYGGVLLASGVRRTGAKASSPAITDMERATGLAFGVRAENLRARLADRANRLATEGRSLGLYCPARALNLLPVGVSARLFDDDTDLHGLYYPTLPNPVESREALIAAPVEELWIMSRSFGTRLSSTLAEISALSTTNILTIGDLIEDGDFAR